MPEDDTLHNHRCENLESYKKGIVYESMRNVPSPALVVMMEGEEILVVPSQKE
jgi:hypothetical protein